MIIPDYVLVYEDSIDANTTFNNTTARQNTDRSTTNENNRGIRQEESTKAIRRTRKAECWRESFLQNLEGAGLYTEEVGRTPL